MMKPFKLLLFASLLALAMPVQAQEQTLYQRIGGYDAIAAVVDDFVGRMATDAQLGRFFDGHSQSSLTKIRQLVIEQICQATGGPCLYTGRDMKTVHKGLRISESHWDVMLVHFRATMDRFQVPEPEREQMIGFLASLKADIVETTGTH